MVKIKESIDRFVLDPEVSDIEDYFPITYKWYINGIEQVEWRDVWKNLDKWYDQKAVERARKDPKYFVPIVNKEDEEQLKSLKDWLFEEDSLYGKRYDEDECYIVREDSLGDEQKLRLTDFYLESKASNIEKFFPIEYTWNIDGEVINNVTTYKTLEGIDGTDLADMYIDYPDSFFDRLQGLDRAEIWKAKDWLEDKDYERPGWPSRFYVTRVMADGTDKVIYRGGNGKDINSFEEKRRADKKRESFAAKVARFDEAYEEELRVGDVPFDKPMPIDISFYIGNREIEELHVQADSLGDLLEVTADNDNYPLTFANWIRNGYYGKGWFSPGEELAYYANALNDRFVGDWIDMDTKKPMTGIVKAAALSNPEDLESRWFSYSVVVSDHLAAFESYDLMKLLPEDASVNFDKNAPAPTAESLGLDFEAYYKDGEQSQISPSRADWETEGIDVFPFEIDVLEDDYFDLDSCRTFDDMNEFEEFLEELPIDNFTDELNFKGTAKEALESLKRWFYKITKEIDKEILPETATNWEGDEPSYRWLTLVLADEEGDVVAKKSLDMLRYFKDLDFEDYILEDLESTEQPTIPGNIH